MGHPGRSSVPVLLTLLGACHTLIGHNPPASLDASARDQRGANDLSRQTDQPDLAQDARATDSPIDQAKRSEGGGPCPSGWSDPAWTRRQRIAIDASTLGASLTSFPLLVRLDLSAYSAGDFNTGGSDVRFVSAVGSHLPHETELWDTTQKLAWLWVAVPSITAKSVNEHLWIYFRNPGSGAPPKGNVWDASFVGVWHLQQNPAGGAGAVKDSSQAASHGTASGMTATNRATAKIGTGYGFDGEAYLRIPSTATGPLALTPLTLEAWVRLDSELAGSKELHTVVARQLGSGWKDSYTLLVQDNPLLARFQTYPDIVSSTQITKKVWRHLAGVRTATELRLYVDGVQVSQLTQTAAAQTDANDVTIGCEENDSSAVPSECWRGMLDEVRVSKVPRSAAWIDASYRSGAGTLVSLETVESCGS